MKGMRPRVSVAPKAIDRATRIETFCARYIVSTAIVPP